MPATREPSLLHCRSADPASHRCYASTKSEPEQTAAFFEPHLQQIAKLAVLISLDDCVTDDRCSPLPDAVVTQQLATQRLRPSPLDCYCLDLAA